jgi:Ca2+-binding EF-hand superfamily protein
MFETFFNKYDINGDGVISKSEIVNFVKKFLGVQDEITEIVNSIWYRFDTDRSGKLNRREAHNFLNSFLAARGQSTATVT